MAEWNGLDFLFFLIFVVNLIQGMVRGATKEIIALMCLCFAVIFTIKFTVPLTHFFNSSSVLMDAVNSRQVQDFFYSLTKAISTTDPQQGQALTEDILKNINFCIALFLCFTGAYSVTAAGLSVSGFVEVFSFPFAALNRQIGAALGCTRGYIIVLLILVCSTKVYDGSNLPGKDWFAQSAFSEMFFDQAAKFKKLIDSKDVKNYRDVFKGQEKFGAKQIMEQLDGGRTKEVNEFQQMIQQQPTQPGSDTTPNTQGAVSGELKDHSGAPVQGGVGAP